MKLPSGVLIKIEKNRRFLFYGPSPGYNGQDTYLAKNINKTLDILSKDSQDETLAPSIMSTNNSKLIEIATSKIDTKPENIDPINWTESVSCETL